MLDLFNEIKENFLVHISWLLTLWNNLGKRSLECKTKKQMENSGYLYLLFDFPKRMFFLDFSQESQEKFRILRKL